MGKYKLMYKEKGKKRFLNFGPTVDRSANPRYSKIDTKSKAESVKRELSKDFKGRTWKIKRR